MERNEKNIKGALKEMEDEQKKKEKERRLVG